MYSTLDLRYSRWPWVFTLSKRRPWETPRGEPSTRAYAPRIVTNFVCKAAILVNGDGLAVLTDFGLCSVVWNPNGIPREIIRWCAPEVLGSDEVSGTQPTYASDVFSFGMVILEASLPG